MKNKYKTATATEPKVKKAKDKPIQKPETVSLVNDRFGRARDYRVSTQDEIWKRSYNNYRGVLDTSLFPWRSKLFIPWSFTVVETIIPKIFAREPKWRAVARTPDFPDDGPRTVQDLLTYQWKRMGMRLKMYDYIKDSLMYSKAYAKVSWNYKTRTKTIMEPVVGKDDVITFKEVTKSDVEHDDPRVDIVDPMDIYVDPDSVAGEPVMYLIHRKTIPLAELKDNPNYKNVDQIKPTDADQYLDKLPRFNNNVPPKDQHKKLIEVLEYWEADRLVVIANRSVVLRDTPNPYHHKKIPFIELDDYRDPHKYYGQSELSVIDPLQREINSIRNQRRDYDNLALNPVIQMVPGTIRNPNSAVMAPGAVWMVSDLNSIGVFQLPQLQGSSSEIEERTASDLQRAVAIDEIGIGLLPDNPQRRSATEVVTATTMAGKRFATKIALLEESVKQIGQLIFALNQQFLDKERIIQIVGQEGADEWVKLTPEDVRADYFIDLEVGSMLPKDEIAARKEAVELLQYITPIIAPVLQANPAVMMPIIQMVLDTFELPNKRDILAELQKALGVAKQGMDQDRQAANAATEAQALGQLSAIEQQAAQAEMQAAELPGDPKTLQGERADLEAEQALAGEPIE